jgi:hypothetical protein
MLLKINNFSKQIIVMCILYWINDRKHEWEKVRLGVQRWFKLQQNAFQESDE